MHRYSVRPTAKDDLIHGIMCVLNTFRVSKRICEYQNDVISNKKYLKIAKRQQSTEIKTNGKD